MEIPAAPHRTAPLGVCPRGNLRTDNAVARSLIRTAAHIGRLFVLATMLAQAGASVGDEPMTPSVDWTRDVRPILSDHCFACHGPDDTARQAELRLDTREGIEHAKNLLIARITATDERVMPPAKTGKKLTTAQIDTLRKWIAQGATWQQHWAFTPPVRPTPPSIAADAWSRTPVDQFVRQRQMAVGLTPAPTAPRAALLRRMSLDLTGLPPTPEELDEFEENSEPDAWLRAIDRRLASPRYGEHRAREWLDAARYADTHGYFTDHERFMWRWRQWVIEAFNAKKPFDEFTVEQLAGDLLPQPTTAQMIATGFHRNHMVTEETGVVAEEYRTEYVADRVRTTAAVWLGLTAGCAQCHDHKFDPLTQRDFYRLFAYFNQVPEEGISGGKKNAAPLLDFSTPDEQKRQAELRKQVADLARQLQGATKEMREADRVNLAEQLETVERELREQLSRNTVMVMRDREPPRETFVLTRGQYDQPGQRVDAGVPAFLPPLPTDAPPNRLSLARWLVSPRNPLTSRVAVNRAWKQMFGQGIVTTLEDFGVQGAAPSHPELLDYLAVTLIESEWDVARIERELAFSAVFTQSSDVTPQLLAVDPPNRWLARSTRFRLDAEVLRDSALLVSGLLVEQLGGPSVKPYQPADLWKHITYDRKNTQTYDLGQGADLVRRSCYTYWKRQIPPPTMQLLDAPSRETCVLRRQRTNTPLQSLALLNDVPMIEAARALGRRMLAHSTDDDQRIAIGFRLVTGRVPDAEERRVVRKLVDDERRHFTQQTELARRLLEVGSVAKDASADINEWAAWTVVGNLLLNLDEHVTRP